VFELHGVDEDAVTTRRATRVLSEFIEVTPPRLEACNSVPDVIAWINTLLDFLGRSGFTLQYEQYLQMDFLCRTIRKCAEVVFEARTRCATWPAVLDDIIGIGYVPIMSIHKARSSSTTHLKTPTD
jgi:hypothetical protein